MFIYSNLNGHVKINCFPETLCDCDAIMILVNLIRNLIVNLIHAFSFACKYVLSSSVEIT